MLQAELGGADYPDGDPFKKLHQTYNTEKMVILTHARRLIRCIIDCQLQVKDAVSVKNALELGRSLSARAWDNTPQQLREVPGVGIVFARKLASGNINRIESLMSTEPERIDLVLGKCQPFGRNLLRKLNDYPDLRITVKEMGREVRHGKGVMLKLKAEIGFLNEKLPEYFNRRQVSVIFTAEDSEGRLWDFRRFAAKKVQSDGEILFTIELTSPARYVRCSVMCDEIVGTLRYAEVAILNVPASAFPKELPSTTQIPRMPASKQTLRSIKEDDRFEDDDLNDSDLLAAISRVGDVEVVQDIDSYPLAVTEPTSKARSKDKVTDKGKEHRKDEYREPHQLPSGRWTCQHFCKDEGVDCKHKCCIEGVVKPKPRPKALPKPGGEEKGQQKLTTMTQKNVKSTADDARKVLDLDSLHASVEIPGGIRSDKRPAAHSISEHATKRPKTSSHQQDSPNQDRDELQSQVQEDKQTHTEADITSLPDNLFDLDDNFDVWTAEDCDWNGPTLIPKASAAPVKTYTTLQAPQYSPNVDPPVPYLSLADLEKPKEKGLFITGAEKFQAKSKFDAHNADREISEAFASTGERSESSTVDWDIFEDDPYDATGSSMTVNAPEAPTARPQQPLEAKTSEDVELGIENKQETDDERKKRLYEEDQKKRWEGVDPWIYEQFHHLVELI